MEQTFLRHLRLQLRCIVSGFVSISKIVLVIISLDNDTEKFMLCPQAHAGYYHMLQVRGIVGMTLQSSEILEGTGFNRRQTHC
jgi:hypothetical protein